MSRLREWTRRVAGLFHKERRDAELEEELAAHLEMMVEQNIERGMTAEEARRAARIALGAGEQIKEAVREQRGLPFLESLIADVRFGLRMLRKNPGFTATAILTLALGIGANTAIFTVVYGALMRALPFPDSGRVIQLAETYKGQTGQMSVTATELRRLRDFATPFAAMSGYTDVDFDITAGSGTTAEHVRGMPVSADFLRVLGEQPEAGRNFSAEEDSGDGASVALVSYALSVRRFGSPTEALGKTLFLSGTPYTVVGVMPAHFAADLDTLDGGPPWAVWIPLARVAKTAGSGENINVLARMKLTATWAQVTTETDLARAVFHKEFPGDVGDSDYMQFMPLSKLVGVDVQPYLLILLGATGFVLLIACANVSNLLLARGSARTRELAVRLAMGASRGRLLRQLLTESLIIAVAGGAVGFAIASEGITALLAAAPGQMAMGGIGLPRIHDIRVDWTILGFALGVSFLCGALFGIVPALHAGRTNLNLELREGSSGGGNRRSHARLREGLIAGEFALSLVLLAAAGLMIATCAKLLATNPGFDPHHVLTMEFWLDGTNYNTTPKVAAYYDEVERRVAALPGVRAVGIVAAGLPLERGGNLPVRIAGPEQSKYQQSNYREASPGYFRAMGITILEGRGILRTDTGDSQPVVVINDAFARRYYPNQDPLDGYVYIAQKPYQIIGVAADAKSDLSRPAAPATFIPAAQASYGTSALFEGWFPRRLVLRTDGDPLAISREVRDAVTSVDSSVATGNMVTMDQMMSRSVGLQEFMMLLLSMFGGLALLLASVGIYGVISYAVSQRTREIGIRMALGARPDEVLRMVLVKGLKLVFAGVILGIAAAAMLTQLLQNLIYGLSARDPLVFVLAIVALAAVAMAACYVPARRAMRVDPMVALRHE
jgi:putative ABC transport system permease protein